MDKAHQVDDDGAQVRTALSAALKDALRTRDMVAASALRSALSAIGNAESVAAPAQATATTGSPHFAGAVAGLGAGEVARRRLSTAEVDAIVRAEIADRQHAADDYAANGRSDRAVRLRHEASVIAGVITALDQDS